MGFAESEGQLARLTLYVSRATTTS